MGSHLTPSLLIFIWEFPCESQALLSGLFALRKYVDYMLYLRWRVMLDLGNQVVHVDNN